MVLQLVNVQNTETQRFSFWTPPVAEDLFLIHESSVASSRSLLADGLKSMELNYSSSHEDDIPTSINDSLRNAYFEIDNYKEKRLDTSVNLLEYWESKKFAYP